MWRLSAYAKLNLGLEILGRRPDGYHEIVSVTQTISLADTVHITAGGSFSVQMRPPLVSDDDNLAGRASQALAAAAGIAASGRLTVRKRIPLAAGLGGGSSDAASALQLLDRMWDTRLGNARLAEIAATIGSDVPLFLAGAPNLIRGRGEIVEPLLPPPTFWVVLATPDLSPADKTRALYRSLTPGDLSDGAATVALAAPRGEEKRVSDALVINGFDGSAERVSPEFAPLRVRLGALLQTRVHLTGA